MIFGRGIDRRRWRTYLELSLLGRVEDCPPKTGAYQDYPYFRRSDLEGIRGLWKGTLELMRSGRAPRELGIYVHWPYCPSQCTYCYCSMIVPKSNAEMAGYLEMLKREMDAFSDLFAGTPFTSVWLGGGTPTFISDRGLDDLLGHLRSSFRLAPGAQFYVESSPATFTETKLDILLRHGVNRFTLGVQSLDDSVLALVDRHGQTRATVEKGMRLLAKAPGIINDVDLVVGLEGQSKLSFIRDLSRVIRMKPQVIHVYGFDPRPHTIFSQAGRESPIRREDLEVMMELAERILRQAGYRRPQWSPDEDEVEALEERQDGTLRKVGGSVLGFGFAAKSHAFGSGWYQHRPQGAGDPPEKGLPAFYAFGSGWDGEMREYAVRNLALFRQVSRAAFRRTFGADPMDVPGLSRALSELEASGLLSVGPAALRWTGRDRVELQAGLKHLYPEKLVRALLRGHRSDIERWREELGDDEARLTEKVEEKAAIKSLFRVYLNEEAARRAESRAEAHALS